MYRRMSALVLLALLASLLPIAGNVASAASFRTWIAQVPTSPGTGSVRIWMNSDTAPGETAALETLINGSYVKRLGTYDTSYSGANWRVDIPGQAAGTTVQYQLFTRNQFGNDYGFSGFNFSYTTSGVACAGASVGDNNVFYSGLFHDSFSTSYRSPTGPVSAVQGTVTLRLRTCANDLQSASLRVWNDRSNSETIYPLAADGNSNDPTLGPISFWKVELPISSAPTALYYTFRAGDGTASGYYRDDDPKFLGGGFGSAEANQNVAYDNSYQISVYDPAFNVPSWMQRGIIYQIFPDRFRDGDPANNPAAGRFSYGPNVAIVRSNSSAWNTTVCDPRAAGACFGRYGDNFYGGDLQGVTQKISDGYFSGLGVTVLYLNPIFRAPSNHKYDTANFLEIDPDFGSLADFQAMVAAANARGIRVMLDGVFNHTSSDSPYFDRYQRYNAAGQLTAPNGGANDGSGACEAVSSAYGSWFYFPAGGNPGKDGATTVYCADASGNPTVSYEAWYGYSSLPKIQSGLPQVRDYFYGSAAAVGPYWTGQGASAWRFDVGADVDPGLTNDAGNNYWEGFRAAVRNPALTGKNDTVMLGEEWGDATAWLLGNEWDSVMNYRFRSIVMNWLFTGCTGNGCTGGTKFQENDSNDNSSSGAISYLSPSQFNARLRSIQEDYPPMAFKAMMNLAGSHDTQRLRFMLKKINNDNDSAAVQRMKEWWLFAFTYAGAPTLYYGDEVGLSQDGVWDGTQFQDDPYNRTPFPWADASGSAYVPDTSNLQAFARQMASIRQSYPALQDGDVQHGLVVDDAKQLYGFARTNGAQTALVLLNRSATTQSASFSGLNSAPYNLANGTVLLDAISGATYTVAGGSVSVSVTPSWGAVLLEQSKIETPAAASLSAAGSGSAVQLSWPIVTADSAGQPEVITSYALYRGGSAGFSPSAANRIATLASPAFGGDLSYTDAGAASGGYFYIVRSCNAAGQCANSSALSPTKQTASLSLSSASGTYGGSITLAATLSAGATNLAGRTLEFSLNGSSVGSATSNASGVATLSVALGAIGAGDYPGGITASFAGDSAYNPANASAALSVAKATATLALSGLSATYDGSPQAASVTSSPAGLSGVSLTYNGSPSAPTNAGSYGVVASLDNPNYSAADATGLLSIAKATASVTLGGLTATYDGMPQTASATTAPAGLTVSLSYSQGGQLVGAPTNAGDYSVTATVIDDNYQGGATATLRINKATATIILANLTQGYTGTPRAVELSTEPAGLEGGVSVSYNGSATAPSDAGSYSVAATLSDPNYIAEQATGTLTIIVADQTISFAPLADKTYGDADFTVSATASSGLAVSFSASGECTISGNTVSISGAGSCSITASQAGGGNYDPALAVTRSFTIAKAMATITLASLTTIYNGTPQGVTATTSPSGLFVSFTYNGAALVPSNAGSYLVSATIDNPNYTGSTSGSLVIAQAAQVITLSGVPASITAGSSFTASATASSGLAVNLSVGGPCTLSGSTVSTTAAGTCTVTASQSGDTNYNPAPTVSQSVSVNAAPTTYSFNGFFSPVDNPPTINIAKAGSAIPVKFTLGGNFGLNIFQSGHPAVALLDCPANAPSDAIETTVSAASSKLNYDAATGQYTYVWKTEKAFANSCRQLVLKFTDGTVRTATFNFTR